MPDNEESKSLQSAFDELKCINRTMDKICRVSEINHIMSIIIDELINLTDADEGVVNLLAEEKLSADPDTVVRAGDSENPDDSFKVPDLIAGWVIRNKRIFLSENIETDARVTGLSSSGGRHISVLCCPMVTRGKIIGLTTLVKGKDKSPFSDDNSRVTGIITSQTAQILSNAILLKELAAKTKLLEISRKKLHDENIRLSAELKSNFGFENIISKSSGMKKVLTMASKVATNDSPVLVTGPTGTGKELIAQAIHYNSNRRDKAFVVKNCGVKTESLLEAELFGYVKGAFTGADRDKPGLFREADGGTILLDEVGEAPLTTQVAILRVLENGEIRPVGASKTETVNVRVISATNRDLSEEIEKGDFRRDLFYRLNTFTIELPPLSHRRDDIPLLVHYFMRKLKEKLSLNEPSITQETLDALIKYSWPGNVRQLENEIERALVLGDSDGKIDIKHLSPEILKRDATNTSYNDYRGPLKNLIEDIERSVITATLVENDGNILRTSKILDLTRKGLKDKMARYGISTRDDHKS
ncbi:MAG: sigma-54-dependent Fis family transcriptional regulator [candidate division Zixibacteria bacterium]